MIVRAAALAFLVGMLATGCAPESGPGVTAAPVESGPSGTTAPAYDAAHAQIAPPPIAPYLLSAGESFDITEAERVLADTCMARYGFDLPAPRLGREWRVAEEREADLATYGLNDLDRARTYGYQDAFLRQTGVTDTDDAVAKDQGPTFTVAMVGYTVAKSLNSQTPKPQGGNFLPYGCVGQARVQLWGEPMPTEDDVARSIKIGSYEKAQSDARVVGLFASWSSCMKARGYQFVHPFDHSKVQHPPRDAMTPSAAEVTMAVADVECKRSVDLVPRWSAVVAEYEAREIEKQALELQEARTRMDAALKNANKVLAAGE